GLGVGACRPAAPHAPGLAAAGLARVDHGRRGGDAGLGRRSLTLAAAAELNAVGRSPSSVNGNSSFWLGTYARVDLTVLVGTGRDSAVPALGLADPAGFGGTAVPVGISVFTLNGG